MFLKIINENMILVLFMIIGFALRKSNSLNSIRMEGLSKILTNVALPAAITISLQTAYTPELLRKVLVTLFITMIAVFCSYMFALVMTRLFHIRHFEKRVWLGCCTFSNLLFIGIPIIGALYGTEGVLMLVSYNTVSMFLLFTLGVVIYKNGEGKGIDVKQFLLNPAILATFIGFIFFVMEISLPSTAYRAIDSLGSMTAPLSMIITGATMAENRLLEFVKDYKVYLFSVFRLLLIPAIMFLILKQFLEDPIIIGVLVIAAAMPSGAMNVVLAEQYSSSGAEASKYVVMTTILSIFTLPLMAIMLG